jgi:hypothetical protein
MSFLFPLKPSKKCLELLCFIDDRNKSIQMTFHGESRFGMHSFFLKNELGKNYEKVLKKWAIRGEYYVPGQLSKEIELSGAGEKVVQEYKRNHARRYTQIVREVRERYEVFQAEYRKESQNKIAEIYGFDVIAKMNEVFPEFDVKGYMPKASSGRIYNNMNNIAKRELWQYFAENVLEADLKASFLVGPIALAKDSMTEAEILGCLRSLDRTRQIIGSQNLDVLVSLGEGKLAFNKLIGYGGRWGLSSANKALKRLVDELPCWKKPVEAILTLGSGRNNELRTALEKVEFNIMAPAFVAMLKMGKKVMHSHDGIKCNESDIDQLKSLVVNSVASMFGLSRDMIEELELVGTKFVSSNTGVDESRASSSLEKQETSIGNVSPVQAQIDNDLIKNSMICEGLDKFFSSITDPLLC